MITLDTKVVSDLMRSQPNGTVLAWLARQPMAGLLSTTLNQAEIYHWFGLAAGGQAPGGYVRCRETLRRSRSAKCQVEAILRSQRVFAPGQCVDAMESHPRRTAPDHDVTVMECVAARAITALMPAPQEGG